MDSSGFDGQARQHLHFYSNFMRFIAICVVAAVAVLLLMAAFLL